MTTSDGHGTGGPRAPRRDSRSPARLALDVGIGVGLPAAVAALLVGLSDEPLEYRPGTVLLVVVAAVAALLGLRAGVVATTTSSVAVAWYFTEPTGSLRVEWPGGTVSLLVFVAGAALVLWLVARLERARHDEAAERRLLATVLDEAPIGIAVFDTDARFVRVNRRLEQLNRLPESEHLGRRPEDIAPEARDLYQHLIEEVARTGRAIEDRELQVILPEQGIEKHWRASYYPVLGPGGRVDGVGATVADVTSEVVDAQRSHQLLRLTEVLNGVTDTDGFAVAVARFLRDAFGGRSAVAIADADSGHLSIRAASGYPGEVRRRHGRFVLHPDVDSPLTRAVRDLRPVSVGSPEEYDARFPGTAAERVAVGDRACTCVPLLDPNAPERAMGALHLAWPVDRELSPSARTLLHTVTSVAALALSRVRLTSAAEQDRFRRALDAMQDNVAITHSVRDEQGAIVDFVIDFVNRASRDGAGRDAGELVGRRVNELYPSWQASGMFDRFRAVVDSGVPFVEDRLHYRDDLPDGRTIEGWWSVQIVPFGDGYIAASRDVTRAVLDQQVATEARALAERERVAVELLQRAALPVELPSPAGVAIGARYRPADPRQPVGGDWYDAFLRSDGTVTLVIADVSGHGPDAAAFMVQVRNVLRALAARGGDPGELLTEANAVTCELQPSGRPFITCCVAVLDPTDGAVTWARAGHFAPLVVGGVARFAEGPGGVPLGTYDDARYGSDKLRLDRGQGLVLFTDGLVERRGEVIDVGLDRLVAAVEALGDVGPQELADRLAEGVEDPFDDLAVLTVRRS